MLRQLIDIALVLSLTYAVLILIGERRTLWMVRGFVVLMLLTAVCRPLDLTLLNFFLTNLTLGAAVAMAVLLQTEFRRFLERLGRGEIGRLLTPVGTSAPKSDDTIDELVDAVKELSQNRTGALIVMETDGSFDERDFSVPGVQLHAQVSKELIQTIFQTSTLLHDGAMLIQGASIASAGAILPLSDRQASRQLGTRHRAAMGITERVENCLCVVVSEETGSISLAEHGVLNRPLTSSRLRELLQERFSVSSDREVRSRRWPRWKSQRHLRSQVRHWFRRLRKGRNITPPRFPKALKGSDRDRPGPPAPRGKPSEKVLDVQPLPAANRLRDQSPPSCRDSTSLSPFDAEATQGEEGTDSAISDSPFDRHLPLGSDDLRRNDKPSPHKFQLGLNPPPAQEQTPERNGFWK